MPEATNQSFIRPEAFWQQVGLRAQQTVVHLGSGPGFYLIPAAKIVGSGGKAIGIDVLPDMLAESEGRAKREGVSGVVQTIRANLEIDRGSTLADGVADWVLIANILYQSDPARILQEARRILRPSGTIIVVAWDVAATPFGPPSDKRLSRQDLVEVARTVGLQEKGNFHPSPYHYGLLLSRVSR